MTQDRKPNPPADWPERFLAAYARCGSVSRAAKAAKVDRRTVQRHRSADSAFAAAMSEAHAEACDALEDEARRRAVTGTLRPVYYQGKEVGKVREYSDALLVTLLKANLPEKYRENARLEHEFSLLSDADLIERAKAVLLADNGRG